MKDFRPISLLGNFYKILAKVLAKRLVDVLDADISPSQNAFIRGRQILNCSLIVNKCIDVWCKEKKVEILCKVNMEKANGHVN